MEIPSRCHNAGYRFQHGIHSPVIGAPGGQIGIKTVTHHGNGIRFPPGHGKLCHHALSLRELVTAAVGHIHASRPDRAVKPFHQALLGADIQIGKGQKPCRLDILFIKSLFYLWR